MYALARERAQAFRRDIAQLLVGCDVLAMPTTPGPAPELKTTGDLRWQSPWSFAGLPAITIPCGFAALNLPLGLQLVARDDAALLQVATACEEALNLGNEIERLLG